jgi:hypothetical protein
MPRLSDTLPLPDQNATVVLDDAALFGTKPRRTVKCVHPAPGAARPAAIDYWEVRVGLILVVVAAMHLGLGTMFGTLTPGNASAAIEGVLIAIVLIGWGAFRWRDDYVLHQVRAGLR